MPNKKSSIWQYFTKIGTYHVRCNLCRTVLKITRGSTSPMWLHARRQHGITDCIPQPKTSRRFPPLVRIPPDHVIKHETDDKRKRQYCVGCEEVDRVPDNDNPAPPPLTLPSTVPMSGVGAAVPLISNVRTTQNISREDLYALLSTSTASVTSTIPTPPRSSVDQRLSPNGTINTSPCNTNSLFNPTTTVEGDYNGSGLTETTDAAISSSIRQLCSVITSLDHRSLEHSHHVRNYAEAILALRQALQR